MGLSQILWGILVFLYDILKTGREYLVSMIVTTCAVLLAVGPVTGSIAVAIITVWQLLVCVSRLVKKFVVGLLHVTPNLFTAGFPRIFYDRAGFRAAVWDMILDEPPLSDSSAAFMAFLVDKGYPTAPFQFCAWYSEFSSRPLPGTDNHEFSEWSSLDQQNAMDRFAPGSPAALNKALIAAERAEITPWELSDQPPASVFHELCQEEAAAITIHLYRTNGLFNPFFAGSGKPFLKELQVVLATFFTNGGNAKLDLLSDTDVSALLIALQFTSHFTAFHPILQKCALSLYPLLDEFRQVNSTELRARISRVSKAAYLGFTITMLAIALNVLLVCFTASFTVSADIMVVPVLSFFTGILIKICTMNIQHCLMEGYSDPHLHCWEAFLTAGDYVNIRKKAGFFCGIAEKEVLLSPIWSPAYNRIFLWNNLCLALGEKFENTFGKVYTLLFNDRLVNKFHEYLHKNFKPEVWVQKPGYYDVDNVLIVISALLSLFSTGFLTGWFLVVYWELAKG